MKCEFLGIDIQDDMGRHEVGFVENTVKTPIGIDESGCLFEARFHINKVYRINGNIAQAPFDPLGLPKFAGHSFVRCVHTSRNKLLATTLRSMPGKNAKVVA